MAFELLNNLKDKLLPSSGKKSNNSNFGLIDFYQTATDRGFARDFHFRVTQIADSKLNNDELVYIRSGSTPEREIGTETVAFRGFKYNVPLTASYPGSDNWTIEFLMDKQYAIYDTIEAWHRSYFNESTYIGRDTPTIDSMVELIAIDESLNIVKKFRLYGCFPRKLGSIKFNIGGTGAPVTFELGLAYQYWESETINTSNKESKSIIDQFVNGLRQVTNIVQGGRNVIRSVKSIPGL